MSRTLDLRLGLLIFVLLTGTACPQSSIQDVGLRLEDTPPTFDGVRIAAAQVKSVSCRTPKCRSMLAFDEMRLLWDYVVDNADMTGADRILYSPAIVWNRYRHALLDHPPLYAPFCHLASAMLRNVPSHPHEGTLPMLMLTAGVDIDLRDPIQCAKAMVDALPRSSAIAEIRRDAESTCRSPFDYHHRPRAACATLIEGLPPATGTSND